LFLLLLTDVSRTRGNTLKATATLHEADDRFPFIATLNNKARSPCIAAWRTGFVLPFISLL
jgi:hypothetical protein